MKYCMCCGKELGARWPKYHSDDPCHCDTCKGNPNYCTEDGGFIGTVELHRWHQIEAHSK